MKAHKSFDDTYADHSRVEAASRGMSRAVKAERLFISANAHLWNNVLAHLCTVCRAL